MTWPVTVQKHSVLGANRRACAKPEMRISSPSGFNLMRFLTRRGLEWRSAGSGERWSCGDAIIPKHLGVLRPCRTIRQKIRSNLPRPVSAQYVLA